MVAGAAYLSDLDRRYVLDLADDWNHRIEGWTYVHGSWLDTVYGLAGHYVRVGPDPQTGVTRIANQADTNFKPPSSGVIGLEYLYLPRLGLRDPQDPRITDTSRLVDAMLTRDVGTGTGYYRYNYDGYGEQVDGANWTGVDVGRVWPLLVGERGHGAVLAGQDGLTQLTAMLAMRSPAGLVPEQVWDQPPLLPRNGIPSLPLLTGSTVVEQAAPLQVAASVRSSIGARWIWDQSRFGGFQRTSHRKAPSMTTPGPPRRPERRSEATAFRPRRSRHRRRLQLARRRCCRLPSG